jgi:hypothetical protein
MAIRNSEALDVLIRVAADSRVSWRAVELAGRGISADAAGTIWVMDSGKKSLSGDAFADLLMAQVELVDELADTWRLFDEQDISLKEFEERLESIVVRFEEWGPRS